MPISEFDAMAHHPLYRSQFGDTTFTRVFVGGLAWETPAIEMRKYFEQFGDILEAVIISDKHTGKSKGYGFVTFRDPESARRACVDPKPVIDGRRTNCNIASLGRPRPSPSPGRNMLVQGDGGGTAQETPSYSGVPTVAAPLPLMYPAAYGYPTYSIDYGYHQGMLYNTKIQQPQQYYQQLYAQSYYYGYSTQSPRPTLSTPHRLPPATSYLYHSTSMEACRPPLIRHPFPSPSADSETQRRSSSETEAGVVVTSESAIRQGKNS